MSTFLPQGIAILLQDLKYKTLKLQRTADSIGFVQEALWHKLTPTFANSETKPLPK